MRVLSLFAGIGAGMLSGLILGHEHIACVEWDAYRCAVLRERAGDGWFPGLIVHECDVREFDPMPYAGRVDCVCAGFPCQDVSRIGSGDGLDGERSGLWSEVLRVVDAIRPAHVFLENGPDIVACGADRVLADFTAVGYDARWGIVSAANAGAKHLRARWWCMADRVRDGLEGLSGGGCRRGQLAESVAVWMADAAQNGRTGIEASRPGASHEFWRDADGCLSNPPGRTDWEGWSRAMDHGAPAPGIRRLADADAWRVVKAQVAAIGDAQDPLAAALAWRLLGGP